MMGALPLIVVALLSAPPKPGNEPDPHKRSRTWSAPSPVQQAERDTQRPPAATGAIFVPVMTDPRFEPQYVVQRSDGSELSRHPMGTKTWVRPGIYRVLIGTGDIEDKLEFEATVVEGRTTFIGADWAGLRVSVVNERGTTFRGTYELVRMPEREFVGLGLGANLSQGELLTTWLVPPGKYMLLATGESYRARKNFATLRLPAGELVRYTLVLDETTGDVLGAGEVDEDIDSSVVGPWRISLLLGGALSWNRSDAVVGKPEGMSFDVSAFIESVGGYDDENHLFYTRLYIEEEGRLTLPEGFYLNLVDTFEIDLLYMYRVVSWFGPYVRLSYDTSIVPSYQDFESPTDVVRLNADGTPIDRYDDVPDIQLTVPFGQNDLRYGAGGRLDIAPTYWFDLKLRLGVGARHLFARSLFVNADNVDTPEFELQAVPDFNQFGVESSLLTEVRITRWVLLKAEADILVPFDVPEDTAMDVRGTVALRLASFASLNYEIRLDLDRAIVDDLQIDQTVLLRFAYKIL